MADSPWVLDLSSNPPDIYNKNVLRVLHNAFEPPYPSIFWGVNATGDDVTHDGQLQHHTPCFDQPYPTVFWFTNSTQDDVVHNNQLTAQPMGAFMNAFNITAITFPTTLTKLGDTVATNTLLTSVTIPSTCQYNSDSSFPKDCEVRFFPNE